MVGSLDVESLYPSLDITRCAKVVSRKLYESDLKFTDLNWKEIALYLVFHLSEEELQEEQIREACPRRRSNRGEGPKFTASGSKLKVVERFQPWIFPEEIPNPDMIRKMFCIAVRVMIVHVMSLHDFHFDGVIYRQRTGGSIGLDRTGVVSDIYMEEWDTQLVQKAAFENVDILLYKRYKDDGNLAIDKTNTIVDGTAITDIAMMEKMKTIADSIDPSLTVTYDIGANHEDERMPILDLKVWIEEVSPQRYLMLHTHYTKEVSSKLVIKEKSSHGERMKMNVMINECDRIMRNCSPHLNWEQEVLPNVTFFVKCLKLCGYSNVFRHNVLVKSIQKYDLRSKNFQEGKSYYILENERNKDNFNSNHEWYKEGD